MNEKIEKANDRYNQCLDSFLARLHEVVPSGETRCGIVAALVGVVDSAKAYEREVTTVEVEEKHREAICAHFGIKAA